MAITFQDLTSFTLSVARRYVFATNIYEVAKSKGNNFLEVSFSEILKDVRIGPYERAADARFDEFFVEKLVEIQGAPKYALH